MQKWGYFTVHHEYVLLDVMWNDEIIIVYIKFHIITVSGNNKADSE
jgi:hypothetical protein